MTYTMKDFIEAVEEAEAAIQKAANIILLNNDIADYFNEDYNTSDSYSRKVCAMKYLEDLVLATENNKRSYTDYLIDNLADEIIEELQVELYKKYDKDYSYTTFKEAKSMIIEDAVLEGLI